MGNYLLVIKKEGLSYKEATVTGQIRVEGFDERKIFNLFIWYKQS